jgi:acyl-CoA synthetase (AMP-forming)/AMP-acid ligase II
MTEKYGRVPFADSKDPFTCGISGKTFTNQQQQERVDLLARGISHELGWEPNQGREWDKVMGVFSFNTIDYMNVCYAVHRLNGVITPANAAYSAQELEYQLKSAGAKGLVTCMPLLETALQAAQAAGIPKERVYITDLPKDLQGDAKVPFKNLDQLIEQGRKRPPLEELKWTKGQGATQTAFLCYSSGTSGLPKGVMISHRNVISNVLQINTFDRPTRLARGKNGKTAVDVSLGLLPMSHIYGLVVGSCAASYAGDQVIILPKFEMATFLSAVQNFKINILYIVPPIIIQLVNNDATVKKYDMSSVRAIFTGAAPLGAETAEALQTCHPGWKIRQGYGLTETCTVVCSTPETDIHFGTAGSLLPGYRARLLTPEGTEITGYNQPGELVVQSPSVVIGYLNNDKANRETFIDDFNQEGKGHLGKWMRTGDEAMIVKSNGGNEHIVITDRIKELIKVKVRLLLPSPRIFSAETH